MLPEFVSIPSAPWSVLAPGVYPATLAEISQRYVYNARRRHLFRGLKDASADLAQAGCVSLYLDGSFITDKPIPGDFDACRDPKGVLREKLDLVFFQLTNNRAAQRHKFGGEFFPSTTCADAHGRTFVDFFQIEKFTGQRKGIVLIKLRNEPMFKPRVTP